MKHTLNRCHALQGVSARRYSAIRNQKYSFSVKSFWFMLLASFCFSACSDSAQQQAEEQQRAQALAYKNAITSLLQSDASVAAANGADYSRIASGMRQLDLSQCPNDFAVAYVDHIHAWENAAKIQVTLAEFESNDNAKATLLAEGFRDIFGSSDDSHPIVDAVKMEQKLKAAATNASVDIRSTFQSVEHIAVAYGATLPAKP